MRGLVRPAVFGLAVASVLGAPRVAEACSFVGLAVHEIDPAMKTTDKVAPVLAPLPLPHINRGEGRRALGCTGGSTCDDFGSIFFDPVAQDDQSPPAEIGYRITLVSGTPPDGLIIPAEARALRSPGARLFLLWYDEPDLDQEPFDFTVEIVAIDRAGNESPPQTVRIAHGGSDGCAMGGRRDFGPERATGIGVLVAVLGLFARRHPGRRRRRRAS